MIEKKSYTNGEVTVTWQPAKCIHSAICFKGLVDVFNPRKRPWINMEGATTASIVEQVKKCPSGALSYAYNDATAQAVAAATDASSEVQTQIEVSPSGPLLVTGTYRMKDAQGNTRVVTQTTALCRCGASQKKPYCDGSHRTIGFKDPV